jgi:hypothetical protein
MPENKVAKLMLILFYFYLFLDNQPLGFYRGWGDPQSPEHDLLYRTGASCVNLLSRYKTSVGILQSLV